MTPRLEVSGLTVAFGPITPVCAMSFSVDATETVALVGESGSGKSLTALALMRLLPTGARITAGTARLDGDDLLALPLRDLRRHRGRDIGMVFQEPMTSLNPVLSIGWQIGEVLRLHMGLKARAARAAAIELLEMVRIPAPGRVVDDYPHQLSGGMRQRVMIAMAVACRPRLLIADEPTTALDVTVQAQVLALLDRLRRDLAISVILITHDLGIVAQWADRVVVMYAGHKVEEARPDVLFARPGHPYTRGLLAASPRARPGYSYHDGPLAEIRGNIGSAAGAAGCPFLPRCDFARPACAAAMPPLRTLELGHLAACPVIAP
jgi:peptide/nickel transport system ATP-binding protein